MLSAWARSVVLLVQGELREAVGGGGGHDGLPLVVGGHAVLDALAPVAHAAQIGAFRIRAPMRPCPG
jgi:hypothetical protein